MRTAIQYLLPALLCAAALSSQSHAQEETSADARPFDGFYVSWGIKIMDYSNLDAELQRLDYAATDDAFMHVGVAFEYSDAQTPSTRPPSARIGGYFFRLPEEFPLAENRSGNIHGWGLAATSIVPIVYGQSLRFGIALGLGIEGTTLTISRTINFDDFVENATENSATASRLSPLLLPGLRFDYRLAIFGDPFITIGVEALYAWDFASGTSTWGDKIIGAPDDKNSGFRANLNFGFPFKR